MVSPLYLDQGHHLLSDPVVHWGAIVSDTHPTSVVLTASIQGPPPQMTGLSQGHTATSVAIQMDARVAIALYERLDELGRSMGWLPQKEDPYRRVGHSSEG